MLLFTFCKLELNSSFTRCYKCQNVHLHNSSKQSHFHKIIYDRGKQLLQEISIKSNLDPRANIQCSKEGLPGSQISKRALTMFSETLRGVVMKNFPGSAAPRSHAASTHRVGWREGKLQGANLVRSLMIMFGMKVHNYISRPSCRKWPGHHCAWHLVGDRFLEYISSRCWYDVYRYGDIAPKTKLGRIFTVIWTLIGIVLTSLVVGQIVNSLTAKVVVTPSSGSGTKRTNDLVSYDDLQNRRQGGETSIWDSVYMFLLEFRIRINNRSTLSNIWPHNQGKNLKNGSINRQNFPQELLKYDS